MQIHSHTQLSVEVPSLAALRRRLQQPLSVAITCPLPIYTTVADSYVLRYTRATYT